LAALVAAVLAPALAFGAPINSDLATAQNGGGCYPTGISPAVLDMLTLVDPEWAPMLNGQIVDSAPVLVHGTVQGMHGDTSGDFPATHIRADVNHFVLLDPEDAGRLATGNDDGLLHFEWEAGAYPPWAWAGTGDRIAGIGRWIFDCGHPGSVAGNCSATTSTQCFIDSDCPMGETCVGVHFGYSAELHPPYATAAIRSGRGAVVSRRAGSKPVLATKADIFASSNGGGAGDRCILTHHAAATDLLSVQCYPLSQPVATFNSQDFEFDLPLSPRPAGARLRWRFAPQTNPGSVSAKVRVKPHPFAAPPTVHVSVLLAHKNRGKMPNGYAGTIMVGWAGDPTPLTHVRVTVQAVDINNALQLTHLIAPKACSGNNAPCTTSADCPTGQSCWGSDPIRSWLLQAAINGEWQYFTGLDTVHSGDVIPQTVVYDQYLQANDAVHLEMNGVSHECVDTLYGQSLADSLVKFGFVKGMACLNSTAHSPGAIDVTYAGPDFGAGVGGSTDYQTQSVGGEGGHCSMTTTHACLVGPDCPLGESCIITGGAFTLQYRIERLP
jgi:hypothetical protein